MKLENDEVTSDSMRIEKELEKYFSNMYASKTNDTTWLREGNSFESFVEGLEIPKLDKEDNESLEQELTVEELKKALNGFSENKTPDEDGFTKEFYEFFFLTSFGEICSTPITQPLKLVLFLFLSGEEQ